MGHTWSASSKTAAGGLQKDTPSCRRKRHSLFHNQRSADGAVVWRHQWLQCCTRWVELVLKMCAAKDTKTFFKPKAPSNQHKLKNCWQLFSGPMTVYAGGQQPNQKTSISSNVLSAQFEIVPINPLLYKFTYPRPWKRALFWFCVCILAFLLILVVSQTIQNRQIRLSPKVIYRDLWGTVRTAFLSSIDKLRKVNSKESKGPTI